MSVTEKKNITTEDTEDTEENKMAHVSFDRGKVRDACQYRER